MTVVGQASLAVTWWSGPIDQAVGGGGSDSSDPFFPRIDPMVFSARGVVPIGYAALAFAVGVPFRRTLSAMAITLAVFTTVQIAMPLWIRPHLGEVRDLHSQCRRQHGVLRCQGPPRQQGPLG
ncbi:MULTISPECIES: hypothetical protein [Streptomyces]|uniref:hypothetical protein n=1 Tax=Streptomyces TaxID=1883 RepID=UPI000BD986C1|nr:hypothetical protein [Streptomyces sp. OK228]SOE25032.1 hypothetical protein SAMN05442782_1722 [Streptomyces sp. OK228]